MYNFLYSIIGDLAPHYVTAAMDLGISWLYLLVLCSRKKTQSNFIPRIITLMVTQVFLCIGVSAIRSGSDTLLQRIVFELALSLLLLGSVLFLYQESVSESLMMFSSIIVTKNFSGTIIPLLRNLFGNNDMQTISFFSDYVPWRDWSLFLGIQLLFLVIITYLFRRAEKKQLASLNLPGAAFLCGIALILKCVIAPVARYYQPVSFELSIYVKILMSMLYLVVIAIRSGLLAHKKIETELQITEGLLRQEKKRYSEMRDSIEMINMRCHDLKRQLSKLQEKLTQDEVDALREAIEIYDSNINTGNEIVDTVLYQKELYCRKNNIQLSWMCDGSSLSFIAPSSLYALLENALENAIEAVMNLPEEQRMITINAFNEDGVLLQVSNYFNPGLVLRNGTSKNDSVHHGFGLKSIRYIVSSYGGTMKTTCIDDVFLLDIHFPNQYVSVERGKPSYSPQKRKADRKEC